MQTHCSTVELSLDELVSLTLSKQRQHAPDGHVTFLPLDSQLKVVREGLQVEKVRKHALGFVEVEFVDALREDLVDVERSPSGHIVGSVRSLCLSKQQARMARTHLTTG